MKQGVSIKSVAAAFFFLCFLSFFSVADARSADKKSDGILKKTSTKVTVDGKAGTDEYTFTYETKGLKLLLTRTENSLYAAVTADTTGWVGIGFKANKMDKSEILIGYFKDGKGNLFEQLGSGHKHDDQNIPYVKTYALTETAKTTTLELELDANGILSPGQKSFPMILAFGGDDTVTSYHRARTGIDVPLGD
jgi:hypothetical protein